MTPKCKGPARMLWSLFEMCIQCQHSPLISMDPGAAPRPWPFLGHLSSSVDPLPQAQSTGLVWNRGTEEEGEWERDSEGGEGLRTAGLGHLNGSMEWSALCLWSLW